LFGPENALRIQTSLFDGTPLPMGSPIGENPPSGAFIDYFVKTASSEPVVLEIYDSSNKLVRRYSSADRPQAVDPKSLDIPAAWVHPSETLPASAGMHRFAWDMHWTAPTGSTGRGRFGGSGRWALPGEYTVKLIAAGQSYSQPLTVVIDPRVKVSSQDLQAQFAAAGQVEEMLGQVSEARQQVTHFHQQLQQARTAAVANQAVAASVDSLDRKLTTVLGASTRGAGGGPGLASDDFSSLEYVGRSLSTLAFSINGAPAAPTHSDLAGIQNTRRILDSDLAAWNQIKSSDVPQLNSLLRQNGLSGVE
jgi:hypothetical protein